MVAISALTLVSAIQGKPHYFHRAALISIAHDQAGELYVIDSPLGIFTARHMQNSFHRKPHFNIGPIRVSIEPKVEAGDSLYLLDQNDKEYRAIVLERKSHPPPPPVPSKSPPS
jgi:hypothetical protein